MKLTFAGVSPFSTGVKPTQEEREVSMRESMPKAFSPGVDRLNGNVVVIMKRPVPQFWRQVQDWIFFMIAQRKLLVMRRQVSGYEWRMYEMTKSQILLSALENDYELAKANGYTVTVLSMGMKIRGGHAYSKPIEWPYEKYVQMVHTAKACWDAYIEQQASRALVY